MEHLLEVKNLSVSIDGPAGEVQAVRDVSFSLKKGEVLAIVGESGCGKSVLCKSIMKLLPPSAKIKEGSICVNGQDITCYREREMQKLRGRVFSMIFQDPMTSLNPTIKIGKQIGEAVVIHNKNYTKKQVNQKGSGTYGTGRYLPSKGTISSVSLAVLRRNASEMCYGHCSGSRSGYFICR